MRWGKCILEFHLLTVRQKDEAFDADVNVWQEDRTKNRNNCWLRAIMMRHKDTVKSPLLEFKKKKSEDKGEKILALLMIEIFFRRVVHLLALFHTL